MTEPPDAVLFDAAGTLIRLDRPAGVHYAEVCGRFGLRPDAERLEECFRAVFARRRRRTGDGTPVADGDRGWWRGVVSEVFEQCGLTGVLERVDGLFEALYRHFEQPGVWVPYPEAAAVLDRVARRGATIGLASNFDPRLRRVLDALGVLDRFGSHVFISSELGWFKPQGEFFRHAAERLGVPASRILHVGDDPVLDGEGAEAAGMRVYPIDRSAGRDLLAMEAQVFTASQSQNGTLMK